MNRYLYTTETGEPVYTASYSHDLDIPEVPIGYRRIEVSLDTSDSDLLANYWLDQSGQLAKGPLNPASFMYGMLPLWPGTFTLRCWRNS